MHACSMQHRACTVDHVARDRVLVESRNTTMMLAMALAAAGGLSAAGPGTDVSQEVPYFAQSMVHVEAESFTPAVGSAWSPRKWGDDGGFFASTVANTFHSRRGYLHAPANSSSETVATAAITVPTAGSYTVLARYEQGYRCVSAAAAAAPTRDQINRCRSKLDCASQVHDAISPGHCRRIGTNYPCLHT
eukprot:COSAG02_NODE_971_length_15551_cov_4.415157_8_plen_190_part_00